MRLSLTRKARLSIGSGVVGVAIVVSAVFILTAGTAKAKEFATLHLLGGTVEVQATGGSYQPAQDGQTLRQGDTVRTGADGRAEITYFDDSVTRLDYGTTFQLKELSTLQNSSHSKLIEASQTTGRTYNHVTELTDSQSRVEVSTPTATASVQGTKYIVWIHADGSTTVQVLEGTVDVTDGSGNTVSVGAGEEVTIAQDGSAGDVTEMTPEELDSAWVQFNSQCDASAEAGTGSVVCGETVTNPSTSPSPPASPSESPSSSPSPSPQVSQGGSGSGPPQNHDPVAGFSASPAGGDAPFTVSIDDSSSDPDGDSLTRQWGFGDGSSHTGGTSLTHTYTAPGDYTISLTVDDGNGGSDTAAGVVHVLDGTPPDTTITGGPPSFSASASASFSFTSSEPDSAFGCSLDGAGFSSCTSPATLDGLAEGPHTFDVAASDSLGNTDPTPAERSWSVDTIAPVLTIESGPSADSDSSDASFAFSSSEVGTGFECSLDGTPFGACSTGGGSSLGSQLEVLTGDVHGSADYSGLDDGTHSFQVRVADLSGNSGLASWDWKIDTTPPADHVVITPHDSTIAAGETQTYSAEAFDADGNSLGDVTSEATFTIEESVGPEALGLQSVGGPSCELNGCGSSTSGVFTVTADYNGFQDTASLHVTPAELDHITIDPTDSTRAAGEAETYSVEAVDVYGNSRGGVTADSTFTIDDSDCGGNSCSSTVATDHTVEASYNSKTADATLHVTAGPVDSVSLVLTPDTITADGLDSSDATATVQDANGNPVVGDTVAITTDGDASVGSVTDNGDGTYSATVTSSTTADDETITAIDGEVSGGATLHEVEVGDTTPPETAIDSGPEGPTNDPSPTFNYSSSEPNSTFECRLTSDSHTPGSFSLCEPGGASYSDLDGTYTFEVRATDAAGNTDPTPASRSFTVDTVAPNPPTFSGTSPPSPHDDNNPLIFGSAEDLSTVELFVNDGCSGDPIASGSAAAFGSSGLVVTVDDNTTTTFHGRATDQAGNVSMCSSDSITYEEVPSGGGGDVVVTLTWSAGPPDHDLHVTTPDGVEVGYNGAGYTCAPNATESDCYVSLEQDITYIANPPPSIENTTIGEYDSSTHEFRAGDYQIGIECFSCIFGGHSFSESNAAVTISQGTHQLFTYHVSGASGDASDPSLMEWNLGSLSITAAGALDVSGLSDGSLETCSHSWCAGEGARASKTRDHAQGSTGNGNASSSHTTPQPQPSPQPHPSPAPSPSPSPSPAPSPSPSPSPSPAPSPSPSPSPSPEPSPSPSPSPPMRVGWISTLPLAVLPLSRLRRRRR